MISCVEIYPVTVGASTTSRVAVTSQNLDDEFLYEQNILGVTPILAQDYIDVMNKGTDSFLVYVGYKECPICQYFSETLKEFLKDSRVTVYYIDWDKVRLLSDSVVDQLKQKFNPFSLDSAPTVAEIKNGSVIDLKSGLAISVLDL